MIYVWIDALVLAPHLEGYRAVRPLTAAAGSCERWP